jgi:hypothetical protein
VYFLQLLSIDNKRCDSFPIFGCFFEGREKENVFKKDANPDGKVETAAKACIALTVPETENCYGMWYGVPCPR